jgi:hypothetical protein
MPVTPTTPSFAAFRGPVEREVFEPGLGLWLRLGGTLSRLWLAAIALPDRGPAAAPDELPPEFYRFPPF